MRNWRRVAVLVTLFPFVSACASSFPCVDLPCFSLYRTPVQPPFGLLFSDYEAPLMLNFDETELGPKRGQATAFYVQDPLLTGVALSWGNADLAEAARKGGISEVRHADYDLMAILGIFVRFRTTAYGE